MWRISVATRIQGRFLSLRPILSRLPRGDPASNVLRVAGTADYYTGMGTTTGRVSETRVARGLIAVSIAFLFTVAGVSQTVGQDSASEVFAPFVSGLRISVRDPQVRITWSDATDLETSYRIYRHGAQITVDSFQDATHVATITSGVEAYIDTPATAGDYLYAVLAEDGSGGVYRILIPYRTSSYLPVSIANAAEPEDLATRIGQITVSAAGEQIEISYSSSRADRPVVVYRSLAPLVDSLSISSATLVATVPAGQAAATDTPAPGVPYYYGVADAALVAEGSVSFVAGASATSEPVEIPLAEEIAEPVEEVAVVETAVEELKTVEVAGEPEAVSMAEEPAETSVQEQVEETRAQPGQIVETAEVEEIAASSDEFVPDVEERRPLPLPFLQLSSSLETGDKIGDADVSVPPMQELTESTESAVARLQAGLTPKAVTLVQATILPDDQLPDPQGAESTLRLILDGPISRLAWEEAIEEFDTFLALPLSSDVASRALFYRAQCFFFIGDNRRAFLEFLLVRDDLYTDVQPWLDTILGSSGGA